VRRHVAPLLLDANYRNPLDYFPQIAEEHLSGPLGGQSLPAPDALRFAGVSLFGVLMETTATWLADGLHITRDELIDRQTNSALPFCRPLTLQP